VDEVREVLQTGVANIGESYAQEAVSKFERIGAGPVWHFIGHLQTNKAKEVVRMADVIHSVDSLRLAEEISKRAQALGKTQRVLLEVNVSGEESKWGMSPDALRGDAARIVALPALSVEGLMMMAPLVEDPEEVRPAFASTRVLADQLVSDGVLPGSPLLSMGMTNDFEVAIEEGASMVRVGTAIFGPRQTAWK